ncbi:hypothetical protein ACFVIM_17005 [Streptomyces sp. NPDC057638]|uniref:hypothetical protein n=1 Tax=Streptomyces sp. NPDC057638 TaxID=3346190 RepID=UPI0036765D62
MPIDPFAALNALIRAEVARSDERRRRPENEAEHTAPEERRPRPDEPQDRRT